MPVQIQQGRPRGQRGGGSSANMYKQGGQGSKKGQFYVNVLFADVFEKCRNICIENYGLCLSHYWSTPASSWDAMLGMTKTNLDLNSEADMYLFLKNKGEIFLIFPTNTVK